MNEYTLKDNGPSALTDVKDNDGVVIGSIWYDRRNDVYQVHELGVSAKTQAGAIAIILMNRPGRVWNGRAQCFTYAHDWEAITPE